MFGFARAQDSSKTDDQNSDQSQSNTDQTNSTVPSSNTSNSNLFGSTQPSHNSTNTTTSTFGSSTSTPSFGSSAFGQSQTEGLFGSTTTPAASFGASTSTATPSSFGFGASTGFGGQAQSGGLFGSTTSSTSTGLFGSSTQATTATPSTTGTSSGFNWGASTQSSITGTASATPAQGTGFGATTSSGWGSSQPSTSASGGFGTGGFGSGWGSTSTSTGSPFSFGSGATTGSTTSGGFGQSSGFGATTSSGWGSSQPSTGGFGTGGFGSGWGSTSTSTPSSFGQGTGFGSGATTGGFGSTAPSSGFGSGWGSSQASNSTSGFGTGGFGQSTTGGFGTGGFGQPSTGGLTSTSGSWGTFNLPTGGFGQPATGGTATTLTQPFPGSNLWSNSNTGTGNPSYRATPDTEAGITVQLYSVTAMPEFNGSSFEELRHEDYQAKKQHMAARPTPLSSGRAAPAQGTSLFGQAATPARSLFGNTPAAAPSPFSTFGQSGTSTGQQPPSNNSSLPAWFGATPQASEASSHMFPAYIKEWTNLASLFKLSNALLFYPIFHDMEVPEEEAQVDLEDQFVDVQFVFEEGTINAHQAVIAANSSYFRTYFRRCRKAKNQKESENDNSNSDTETLPYAFENDMLRVDAKKLNFDGFIEVLASCYSIASTKQGTHQKLLTMLDIIEKYGFFMNRSVLLDKLEALVSSDNVVEILKKTIELENQDITKDSVQRLKKTCSMTVLKNFATLSQTEEFKNLSKEILMEIVILSADKLHIS